MAMDSPSKISFLVPDLSAAGTQRVQVMLAGGMANNGFSVDLVNCATAGPLSEAIPDGVGSVQFDQTVLPLALPKLVSYLKKEKPVVLYSAINGANLLALLAIRLARTNTKLVMTVHTHFGEKWKHQFHLTAPLRRLVLKWMYGRATKVVVVSDDIRDHLLEDLDIVPEKVATVMNPIDRDRIIRMAQAPVSHPWFEDDSLPVTIAVGRLDTNKGFSTLIKAFKIVSAKIPARLIIVGEGPDRPKLERLITDLKMQDEIELIGFDANPYRWMCRSKLFSLSSLTEGFGLVIMEALALELPVVVTDCGSGPRRIAELFNRVKLVPTGNPKALSEAIEQILLSDQTPVETDGPWDQFSPPVAASAYWEAANSSDGKLRT